MRCALGAVVLVVACAIGQAQTLAPKQQHEADVKTAIELCKSETLRQQPNAKGYYPDGYEIDPPPWTWTDDDKLLFCVKRLGLSASTCMEKIGTATPQKPPTKGPDSLHVGIGWKFPLGTADGMALMTSDCRVIRKSSKLMLSAIKIKFAK